LKYKQGDIVLTSSRAGDAIPQTHVKLKERVVVPQDGSWGGYSGWHAEVMYEKEAKALRKYSIPLRVGDLTFVFDDCIIGKEQS